MPSINPVKGTHDVLLDEADAYAYIEQTFFDVAAAFGYRRVVTPVLEHTEVFDRATGESSDIVRKEMYTFEDKAGRSVTLRPEVTAGVMRSIVTNKLYVTPDMPMKFSYHGTAYRYERPQLGRYREFRQLGVECVGQDSAYLDAETIALASRFLQTLGFQNVRLKVNTLGDKASRESYRVALKEYFAKYLDSMCADCKQRFELNPLRILDCKVPEDQKLVEGAPKMKDFLSPESKARYEQTLSLLDDLEIPYEVDDTLVRGLDYYGEIVFEVHCLSPEGHDYGAIVGGGHYQGMLSTFGGPSDIDVGVGFAMGEERVYALMKELGLADGLAEELDILMMPLGEQPVRACYLIADALRGLGYSVEVPYKSGKIGPLFKKAERKKAKFALIMGDDELQKQVIQVKNLATQQQQEVSVQDLFQYLENQMDALNDGTQGE